MIPVFIINLRRDAEKYERLSTKLKRYTFIEVHRVDAVLGSTLPDQLCLALTGDPNSLNTKGAVGTMLSHIRAWEIFLAGPHDWVVVLEDDAIPQDWSGLESLQLPGDYDLIFANSRTELVVDSTDEFLFKPINFVLCAIESRRQAVGADSYIISRAGAKKLLAAFKADGYAGHVDFRMLAYSVTLEQAKVEMKDGQIVDVLAHHVASRRQPAFLRTYAMRPCLAKHSNDGESSRTREDQLGATSAQMEAHKINPIEQYIARSQFSDPNYCRRSLILESTKVKSSVPRPGKILYDDESKARDVRMYQELKQEMNPVYAYHIDGAFLTEEYIVHRGQEIFIDSSIYHTYGSQQRKKVLSDYATRLEAFSGSVDLCYAAESAMVFHNEGGGTWGHFVVQNLPRALAYLKEFPDGKLALPRHHAMAQQSSYHQLLRHFGISSNQLLPLDRDKRYKFRELILVDFLYDFQSQTPNPIALEWLSKNSDTKPGGAIFIERNDLNGRMIANQEEVNNLLARYGVERILLGQEPLDQQIAFWQKSQVIIGTLGSDFTNIVFGKAGTRLLVLSPDWFGDTFFYNLAVMKDMQWNELRCSEKVVAGVPEHKSSFKVNLQCLEIMLVSLFNCEPPAVRESASFKRGNIALGKPALMSSIWEGEAERDTAKAASGGNNGRITGEYGFHTAFEQDPWWQVDLGGRHAVRSVVLYNRLTHKECCVKLCVYGSEDGKHWSAQAVKLDDAEFGGADGNPYSFNFTPPFTTRFVRISLIGEGFLHLDEIEVFAADDV